MIYYTADLHFGHKNIIKYEQRPWSNVKDMDQGLIDRWNSRVKDKDLVYILGDITLSVNINYIKNILSQLKGRKILITGNHDYFAEKGQLRQYFEHVTPYMKIHPDGQRIILCHYPLYSWDGMDHGTIHFYGHVHSNPKCQLRKQNAYNVGADLHDWYPVTFDEIVKGIR